MKEALKYSCLCWLMMVVTRPVKAQDTDTLFLKDGQLLIGKLKTIALGKVDFEPNNIDEVSIKTNKIKTFRAVKHLYRLQTIRRQIIYTALEPAADGKVKISTGERGQELAIEDIEQLTPLRGKTGGLWQGRASAGYSYTRSSNIGRFNADATVGYSARKFEVIGKGSLITTKTDSSFAFENASASAYSSYLFNSRWRGLILLNYQHNLEQGLARRYQEGLAAGLSVISSTFIQGKIISGIVLSQEKNTEEVVTPTQMELPVIFLLDFFHFRNPDMTLNMTQSLYTGITQAGRFRQDGQINLSWKVISDLSISLQLYDNFDNRPPGVNAAALDYGVVFGLSYKFSQ